MIVDKEHIRSCDLLKGTGELTRFNGVFKENGIGNILRNREAEMLAFFRMVRVQITNTRE